MPIRFRRADDQTYAALWKEDLVVCPRCERCAIVMELPHNDEIGPPGWRLACQHCGLVDKKVRHQQGHYRKWERVFIRQTMEPPREGEPLEPIFRRPFWLQAPCCGKTLWARNAAHLGLIESYVCADLREPEVKAVVYKLPRWIITAKHREEVLRCIAKLRRTLDQC